MAAPAALAHGTYGWETTQGSSASTFDKTLGHGVKISTLSRKNNVEKIWSLGFRNAQALVPKAYEGTKGVEFFLANPWFWRAVIGAAPVTTGSGPYVHTYSESDTLTSFTLRNQVNTDTKTTVKLLGCTVSQCIISCEINQLVKVKLDVPYMNESADTSSNSVIAETFEPYSFAEGTLEMPSGTTLAYVAKAELTIKNNTKNVLGMGSRFAQAITVTNRDYDISCTMNFSDSAKVLQVFWGSSSGPASYFTETATLKLTFTNGQAGTSLRSQVLTFAGLMVDEHNLPQSPTELIMEDWTAPIRSLTSLVATDNTSVAP